MREVKYQAYLHREKKMIDVPVIDMFNGRIEYYDTSHCNSPAERFEFVSNNSPNTDCFLDECNLREFTGFPDKNGKEIYEGDILEREYFAFEQYRTFIGEVKMYEGSWWIDNGTAAVPLWNEMHELKVIGNIYEDPNLLEGC